MLLPFLNGFLLGGGLIVAIGAQNAFILRQGLKREFVFTLCLIAALSDALLMVLSIAGMGALVIAVPGLKTIATIGGVIFLTVYGVFAVRSAWSPKVLEAAKDAQPSLAAAIATLLAFTYLNPHVYLDVLMVGSLAGQYELPLGIAFGLEVILASFTWFFSLGYGARWLAPTFASPRAWQMLDAIIALIMFALALSLLLTLF